MHGYLHSCLISSDFVSWLIYADFVSLLILFPVYTLLQTKAMDKEIVKLYKEGKTDKLRSVVKGQTVGNVSKYFYHFLVYQKHHCIHSHYCDVC